MRGGRSYQSDVDEMVGYIGVSLGLLRQGEILVRNGMPKCNLNVPVFLFHSPGSLLTHKKRREIYDIILQKRTISLRRWKGECSNLI